MHMSTDCGPSGDEPDLLGHQPVRLFVETGDRVLSLRKRMIERQDRSIRPPDAIQLACASAARVDLFITNDERLSRRVVPGIHFIQSLATATI